MPIQVQRGSTVFGASADTKPQAVTAVASFGAGGVAYARVTCVIPMSSGPDAGTTTDRFNDDLGITVTWNSTSEIQFNRQSGGTDEDVRVYWEVIEGVTSGGNEWVVRFDGEVSMGTTTTQQDAAVASIGTLGDCVPVITGIRNDRTIDNAKNYQVHAQMVNTGSDQVRLTRHDHNSTTNIVSVVVIEYTGANYTVDNNISHTFVASVTDETETTTDVADWTTAWVESGYIADTATVLDSSCVVRPGATTTTVRFWKRGVVGTEIAIAHVVKCSDAGFLATHYDSITGGETDHPAGSASPQTVNTVIADVTAMASTSLVATAVTEGGTTDAPRAHWAFTLSSITQADWWRARHGAASKWALQVIEWPRDIPALETWTVNDSGGAQQGSIVLTKAADVEVGDLLVLIVGNDGTVAGDFEALAGWNQPIDAGSSSTQSLISVYWREADGTEAATETVTTSIVAEIFGWYLRISGADTTTPIHKQQISNITANDSTQTLTAVTTTLVDCLVLYGHSFDGGDGFPFSPSGTGWSGREIDDVQAGSGASDASGSIGKKNLAAAGSSSNVTVTCSVSDQGVGFQIAIAPGSPPPPAAVVPGVMVSSA